MLGVVMTCVRPDVLVKLRNGGTGLGAEWAQSGEQVEGEKLRGR